MFTVRNMFPLFPSAATLSGSSSPLGAALLDVDGTLVDSRIATSTAWRTWGRAMGLGDDFEFRWHGIPARDVVSQLVPAEMTRDALRLIDDLELRSARQVTAMRGASALMRNLQDYPVALVTSATRRLAMARMRAAGLPVPRQIIAAEDVSNGKPAPEPYLLGCHLLGVEPERAVAFEDAPAGVQSALRAHCQVIGVLSTHAQDDLLGVAVVSSLEEVTVIPQGNAFVIKRKASPPQTVFHERLTHG